MNVDEAVKSISSVLSASGENEYKDDNTSKSEIEKTTPEKNHTEIPNKTATSRRSSRRSSRHNKSLNASIVDESADESFLKQKSDLHVEKSNEKCGSGSDNSDKGTSSTSMESKEESVNSTPPRRSSRRNKFQASFVDKGADESFSKRKSDRLRNGRETMKLLVEKSNIKSGSGSDNSDKGTTSSSIVSKEESISDSNKVIGRTKNSSKKRTQSSLLLFVSGKNAQKKATSTKRLKKTSPKSKVEKSVTVPPRRSSRCNKFQDSFEDEESGDENFFQRKRNRSRQTRKYEETSDSSSDEDMSSISEEESSRNSDDALDNTIPKRKSNRKKKLPQLYTSSKNIADSLVEKKKENGYSNTSSSSENSSMYQTRKKTQISRKPSSCKKAPKSPAVRRRIVQVEVSVSSTDTSDDVSSSEEETGEDSEDDEIKIERIIASNNKTLKNWFEVTGKINTSEIEQGSRWFQTDTINEDNLTFQERYLVKWNGLSYLHCSWETEKDLIEQVDNSKQYMRNFFRKSVNGCYYMADERGDGEYFNPQYTEIERVVEIIPSENISDDNINGIIMDKKIENYELGAGRQFLIKWAGLPYTEMTYEFERDFLLNDVDYEPHVKSFIVRNQKPTKSEMTKIFSSSDAHMRTLYKIFGERITKSEEVKNKKIKQFQSNLMERVFKNEGQLRDYQVEGISWLISNYTNRRNSILADEMGLGKTLQTVVFTESLSIKCKRGPFLIVVPLSTITHWYREFCNWTNLNTVVYHGSARNREFIREYEIAFEEDRPHNIGQSFLQKCHSKNAPKWMKTWMIDVLITTPEMLVTEDFKELTNIKWELLVVDEAHRMKNSNSKLGINLRDPRFKFNSILLLSGTPIQNNLSELWNLLNFIDSNEFDNVDEFLLQFGEMKDEKSVELLHERIRPYILRRLKGDVERSVPPKEETLVEVELTILQKQYYRALYEKNVSFLHKQKKPLNGPNLNNLAMELRKCCNHPFLLRGVEDEAKRQEISSGNDSSEVDFLVKASGKLVFLDKLLPRLHDNGHRVLIFSQFKIMLDIIEDYLSLRSFRSERIDGSITGTKRQHAIDRFQAKGRNPENTPFIMLLSTRAGGVGINLTAADTVIIFDSDWNPQNDIQAQARCHRIGQTKSVQVYRLLSRKTYELQMFHMASLKMGLDQAVLQGIENSGNEVSLSKEEVEKLLRHGAYDIFNEDKSGIAEAESNEFVSQDIDSILERRTRKLVHENKSENAMGSTFSKASFRAAGSKGVPEDSVDIDDPEFWKKMVGDSAIDESATNLLTSKRKRKSTYTEFFNGENEKHSDEDSKHSNSSTNSDDDFFLVDDEGNREQTRLKWGGSSYNEWDRKDAEKVLKHLQTHGYRDTSLNKISQDTTFVRSGSCSDSYSIQELQRMCWSIAFTSLLEAAEEILRKEKVGERIKEMSSDDEKRSDCKIGNGNNAPRSDTQQQLEKIIFKLWSSQGLWKSKAVIDANQYARNNSPRSHKVIEQLFLSQRHNPDNEQLVSSFNENLLKTLKTRGWTVEEVKVAEESSYTRYKYDGVTCTNVSSVLKNVKVIHPELSDVVDHITDSTKNAMVLSEEQSLSGLTERTTLLDPDNISFSSLNEFLRKFAPLQLLFDRLNISKICLSRKLLTTFNHMDNAHLLVSRSTSPLAPTNGVKVCTARSTSPFVPTNDVKVCTEDEILCEAINKMALPPSSWKLMHDATLIRAIVKHGWIDRSYKDIGLDKSLKWDLSSDNLKMNKPALEVTVEKDVEKLRVVAKRALTFLEHNFEWAGKIKGFDNIRIFKTYGIVWKQSSFAIEEEKLMKADSIQIPENPINTIPLKVDLLKRAKLILSSVTVLKKSDEILTDNSLKDHGFSVIDDFNPCNVLLVEMLRGLLKLSFNKSDDVNTWQKLIVIAREEAQNLAAVFGDDAAKEITKHICMIQRANSSVVQKKNVLRVILGMKPHLNRTGDQEPLFPDMETFTPIKLDNTSRLESQQEKILFDKKKKAAKIRGSSAGDIALKRALSVHHIPHRANLNEESHPLLPLTYFEAVLLTVLISSGIPFSGQENAFDEGGSEVTAQTYPHHVKFQLYWKPLSNVAEEASKKYFQSSRLKLDQTHATEDELLTLKRKERALEEAVKLGMNSETFARRSIMLLEAIRTRMGPIDMSQGGASLKKLRSSYQKDLCLGPRVMNWFRKELFKWSQNLGTINEQTQLPYSNVAFDLSEGFGFIAAAYLDKRSCRAIFGQIAQLSKLRLLFMKYGEVEMSDQIPKAVKNSKNNGDVWAECPKWWREGERCQDDIDLLNGLLDYGFTNFDALFLINHESFSKRFTECTEPFVFKSASVQQRVNSLTRELSALDDTTEMMKKLNERSKKTSSTSLSPLSNGKRQSLNGTSTIQPCIDAFFQSRPREVAPTLNLDENKEKSLNIVLTKAKEKHKNITSSDVIELC